MLVFGGDGSAGPSATLRAFDAGAQRWSLVEPPCDGVCPPASRRAALFVDPAAGRVVVAGGETSAAAGGFFAVDRQGLGLGAPWRAIHPRPGRGP